MWFAAFEEYAFFIVLAGLVVTAIGWIALIVRAFRASWIWGFGVLLIPPLMILFIPTHYPAARRAMFILMFGLLLGGLPYLVNFAGRYLIDLGPWEKQVNGELHLTLTGWDRKDYGVLKAKPQAVVLQVANPDVTDATLDFIGGMDGLRELDLNDTQVTDAGLVKLQSFKKLAALRLRGTKISEVGLREFLKHMDALMELDVRDTAASPETIREWKAAKPNRRAMTSPPRPAATKPTPPAATQPTKAAA